LRDFGGDYEKVKNHTCHLVADDDVDVLRKNLRESAKAYFTFIFKPLQFGASLTDYINRVTISRNETQKGLGDPEDPDRDKASSAQEKPTSPFRGKTINFSRNLLLYADNRRPQFIDMLVGYTFAVWSGASLIVPMVIMSLNKSLNKSLITTSISVLLLASFLALGSGLKCAEVLTSTFAYAAVLVVFVGVST
jgi:hypothetical protein